MRVSLKLCLTAASLLALGVTTASATSLEQAKKDGFVRGASANEVPLRRR